MPDVLTSSSSAFRRRCRTGSTQLLRKTSGYDSLLHNNTNEPNDIRKTSTASKKFLRWTACFAFVTKFKRSKSEKLDFISEIDPERRRQSRSSHSDSCPDMVAQHDKKTTDIKAPYRHPIRRPFSHYLERATSMDPDRDSIGIYHLSLSL
ncbi:hypothetical protein BDA99DRAFT_519591 [Phascolomyces articulosus]|uniref:Uncharacterized protein n=1 Tax=Phascolomyces articulosus TaxID=60185 RepID=A0AAD5K6K8_9FUNG|nr:hypothetical protein BDA99DRAFT_519591 [Phascolomyces articulosus]